MLGKSFDAEGMIVLLVGVMSDQSTRLGQHCWVEFLST